MLDDDKRRQNEVFWANLPYKGGYVVLLIIVIGLFCRSVYAAYSDIQQRQKKIEAESDVCLVQFTNKHCEVSNLNDECQKILSCLKRKEDEFGTISFLATSISNNQD